MAFVAALLARRLGNRRAITILSLTKVVAMTATNAVAMDYRNEDFLTRIRELTGGEGVDVVLDGFGGMLSLRPDMASLSVGSNNFPTRVYENPPDLVDWLAAEMLAHGVKPEIEAFDLSHIHQAAAMAADGRLKAPLYIQFVMGVKNAMPADKPTFDFYVETVKRLAPDAKWCAAGIGPSQITVNEWSVAAGGHTRTGLEDNLRLDKGVLAPSNAALVRRVVDLCEKHGRPVASAAEARAILGLRAA